MDAAELMLRFLGSQTFEKRAPGDGPGHRPFVTISREAGAGGRSVAEALLIAFSQHREEALGGWQWVDRAVCESLAADPRLGVSLQSLLDERYRDRLSDYLTQVISGCAPQIKLYHKLFSTVRSLASVGKVIVVGRAGVCATRGLSGGVHVRLIGSRGHRVERVTRRFGWDAARADRWVDEQDRLRAALAREYFGQDLADPGLYDAVINTDSVGPAAAAESIAQLVLARARTALTA